MLDENNIYAVHTGVAAWQSAGTLERVVNYGNEAFTEAWDYLAIISSDGENDYFFRRLFNVFSPSE